VGWFSQSWFSRKKPKPPTVYVIMIDTATGKRFAVSHIPVAQLPKSFEAKTIWNLPGGDWVVEHADPVTAAEFSSRGTLTLRLRKIEPFLVDPKTVLMTLPTISNELAAISAGSTKLNRNVLEMHEDDWRQSEFTHDSLRAEVDSELRAIRAIYDHHRVGIGFDEIHVRKNVPTPLALSQPSFAQLVEALGADAKPFDGIAFLDYAGVVADGFAFRLCDNVALYGLAPGGITTVLAIHGNSSNLPSGLSDRLTRFTMHHGLQFVDWVRAERR
jgi:hypothetical protein